MENSKPIKGVFVPGVAKSLLYLTVLLLSLGSCQPEGQRGTANSESVYFPLREFVEVQAAKAKGKTIRKSVIINGEREVLEIVRNEEDWLQELDFFINADINTNALSQSYATERSEEALIHTLKEGENGRIKKIVVKYEGDRVKSISFHAKTENLIYTSETRGVLFTHAISGDLDNYNVENTQEVVFLKPNRLVVSASILD
jgi:hypothetical protein